MEMFMNEKFYFNKTSPKKLTISFTWDDNFERHLTHIAPLFENYGIRCTFYVNPGEDYFQSNLCKKYAKISQKGFEIGSHGYSHRHFSKLSKEELLFELTQSKESIINDIGEIPITFAFPHHDFDEKMLSQARNIYFETRNTLYNSVRFSLKVSTTIEEIDEALRSAEQNRYTLVFSGHGAFNLDDEIDCAGYEPVSRKMLTNILEVVEMHSELQICTFEQAALKTYLHYYCKAEREAVYLTNAQIDYLKQYGFTIERINNLL